MIEESYPAYTESKRANASLTGHSSRRREIPARPRDHPVFLRAHDQHTHARIGRGDVLVGPWLLILPGIELQAQKSEVGTRRGSDFGRILSDARCEHQRVDSTENRHHRADAGLQAVHVHVKRQLGALVPASQRSQNLPHIAGHSRDSPQTRVRVQYVVELLARQLTLSQQVSEDAGIQRPRAGPHHEAVERSEAHRRIHAVTVANSRQRATIPEMASHEPQVVQVSAEQLRCSVGAVAMIDAVKSVAPNTLCKPFVWAWIHRGAER